MASETPTLPVTTKALAEFVATEPSEPLIDRFVEQLAKESPQTLPLLVARALPIRKVLNYLEKVAEQRIASDRIILFGQEWVDPDQGVIYEFKGAPQEWKVADPDGLIAALKEAGVSQDRLDRAVFKVWKVDHKELNAIEQINVEAKEAIADFRTRGFAPAHLKAKE